MQRPTAGKGFKSPLENGAQMARHADGRPQLERIQTITVLVAWIPVTKSPARGMPLDDRSPEWLITPLNENKNRIKIEKKMEKKNGKKN